MRKAKLARRGDLVVVPVLPGMRATQVEHRFDPIFANRPLRLVFAQLSRSVEGPFADRVKIAVILYGSPIAADRGGDQADGDAGDLEAANEPDERLRPRRWFGVRHHLSEAI